MTEHPHTSPGPAAAPAGPAAARPGGPAGPFAGVPWTDYVRDALAVLLLAVSLAMPWDLSTDATARIEVVLVTLVSLFSVALPYLARAGALGSGLGLGQAVLIRALVNVPYLLLVLVHLVIDVTRGTQGAQGLGPAAALGLAGALLAAQPRRAEASVAPWAPTAVRVALLAVTGLLGVIGVVTLEEYVRGALGQVDVLPFLAALAGFAATAVLVGWPLLGALRGDAAWRLVLIALAAAVTTALLLSRVDSVAIGWLSIHIVMGFVGATVLWPALGVLASAPPQCDRAPAGPGAWAEAGRRLLTLTLLVAGLHVLQTGLRLGAEHERGRTITLLVLALLVVVAAAFGRALLTNPAVSPVGVGYGMAGALLVLGIVTVAVTVSRDFAVLNARDLLLAFGIPVALVVFTTVPLVRGRWTAAAPGPAPVALPVTAGQSPGPHPAPGGPAEPGADEDLRLARDPGTDPAVLNDLAARDRATWVHLARNPATYPGLLAWLGQQGDAEVDRALRERSGTD